MGDVSLPDLPQKLADALGMSSNLFAAQILASLILIMIPVIIVSFLTRGKNLMLQFVTAMVGLCFTVAMTWMPWWVLIIISLITALMFSSQMRSWITGRSTGD